MRFLRRSLTARLITLFLLVTILPLSIIGYISYLKGRQGIIEKVKSKLESVAILKEQEIRNWVEHLEHTVFWLVEDRETIYDANSMKIHTVGTPEYLKARDSLVWEFRRVMEMGHFSAILYLDSESGKVIASSDTLWDGQFKENEPYFIKGKEGIYVSDIYFSLNLGKPTMVISAPVKDDNGKLLGVIVAHADLKYLSTIMLERSGLGDTGETFLVNSSNLLITNTVFAPDGAFKKWIFGQGAKWALEGKSGVDLFIDYRGVPVIGAYRWMGDLKLALIAKQDQSEALTIINKLAFTVLGIGLSIVLIVIVLSILFARTITRPILKLVNGTEMVGAGNLDYRVGTLAKDEIGELSRAFDRMTKNLNDTTVSHGELAKEVTERKRAENRLKDYSEKLEEMVEERTKELKDAQEKLVRKEKLAFLGQLSGSVGHELRNPLGVISNAVYLLTTVHGDADETTKEYLDIISSEVQNSEKIISDLLDFSRTRSPDIDRVYVSEMIDGVLKKRPSPNGVTITTEVAEDIPPIYVDPRQVGQVLDNLIANAYQAMPEGGELKIKAEEIKKKVNLSITDTGLGILKENMKKLFEPLFTTRARGIGLGLYVSKGLIEANGGQIKVKSKEGSGSTFTIILPVKEGRS